jgi:hypothetical protein
MVAAIIGWRDYKRYERTQELTHEIQLKGGQVFPGPTLIDNLRLWWNGGVPDWEGGPMITLFDAQLDSEWLRQRDDLESIPIAYLYLGRSTVSTKDAVRLIARHPLQTYSARGQQEADAVAAALTHSARLSAVDLEESDLTDSGLQRLPLERLEALYVAGSLVTTAGLADLSRCRNLIHISIDGQQLDETVVATLAGLPALERVRLVGPSIRDENVQLIATLQKLTFLNLQTTAVTEAGAENLTAAMPATVIGRE